MKHIPDTQRTDPPSPAPFATEVKNGNAFSLIDLTAGENLSLISALDKAEPETEINFFFLQLFPAQLRLNYS